VKEGAQEKINSRKLEQKLQLMQRDNDILRKRLTHVDSESVPEDDSTTNSKAGVATRSKDGARKSTGAKEPRKPRNRRSSSPTYMDEWMGFDGPMPLLPPPPFLPMMGMPHPPPPPGHHQPTTHDDGTHWSYGAAGCNGWLQPNATKWGIRQFHESLQ